MEITIISIKFKWENITYKTKNVKVKNKQRTADLN